MKSKSISKSISRRAVHFLKVTFGDYTFEARGEEKQVNKQYEHWLDMVVTGSDQAEMAEAAANTQH